MLFYLIVYIFFVQDSKLVIARYKSGYSIPEDIPFEDLSVSQTNENNHTAPKQKTPSDKNTIKSATLSGRQKTRKGIFGIFSGSKVSINKKPICFRAVDI